MLIFLCNCSDNQDNIIGDPFFTSSIDGDYNKISECLVTKLKIKKPQNFITSTKTLLKDNTEAYIIRNIIATDHPTMSGSTYTYNISPIIVIIKKIKNNSALELYNVFENDFDDIYGENIKKYVIQCEKMLSVKSTN